MLPDTAPEWAGWVALAGGTLAGIIAATLNAGRLMSKIAGWVEQRMRNVMRHEINGSLVEIKRTTRSMERRLDRHDRRHSHEQRQLIAALERQGLAPPDGWRIDDGG